VSTQEPAVLSGGTEASTATLTEHETGPRVVITIGPGLRARLSLAVLMLLITAVGVGLVWLTRPSPLGGIIVVPASLTCLYQLAAAGHDLLTLLTRHVSERHATATNRRKEHR
jgi:hypothetical protein